MGSTLAGVGHYVPENVKTSEALERELGLPEGWIFQRVGIRERRIAAPDEPTWVMGHHAARVALSHAKVAAEEIDLLIAHTTISELDHPDVAWPLARELKLAPSCTVMGARFACVGFIGGLHIADQFLKAGGAQRVLVVCMEHMHLPSIHYPASAPLFGDGAAAAVLQRGEGPGLLAVDLGNLAELVGRAVVVNGHLERASWAGLSPGLAQDAGAEPLSPSGNATYWNGRDVFKNAVTHMARSVERVLELADLGREDIDHFLFHQANIKIIKSVARQLELPLSRAAINIDRYANMASATVPTLLSEGIQAGRIKRGDRVVMSAFGTGYSYGSAIMEI